MNSKTFKNFRFVLSVSILVVSLVGTNLFSTKKAEAAAFNPNFLISDSAFTNVDAMDVGAIQRFLQSKNSYLKDFSEGGRTAAQIIWDAAHGHGEASGSWNGINVINTVNPQVILVTLQKEQSLITKTYQDDNALRKAMGYGCPGGGCNPKYAGFTNQVEWGAWQLRYNFEGSARGTFSDYQVGQWMHFYNTFPNPYGGPPEQDVHIDNQATASLYRYTPHVYNGNYNFWRLFNQWFVDPEWSYRWESQNGFPTLNPGQSYNFQLALTNTGWGTWNKNTVRLGTSRPVDRTPQLTPTDGWVSPNRIQMQEDSVAPGSTAHFSFSMQAPNDLAEGTYREYFQLVVDGMCWMDDIGVYWEIYIGNNQAGSYHYQWVSQSDFQTVSPAGTSNDFTLTVKNIGGATWYKNTVRLATSRPTDRTSQFIPDWGWISPNRIQMQEDSVAPNGTATFRFKMKAFAIYPGTYREHFQLVADGIGWMEDPGIYWDITIPTFAYQFLDQSAYPTIGQDEAKEITLHIKNTGGATWDKSIVRLGTSRAKDRVSSFATDSGWVSPNRIQMQEDSVAPNGTATFRFTIQVPPGMPKGTYREHFQLVADGIGWMPDSGEGIYWDINVLDAYHVTRR